MDGWMDGWVKLFCAGLSLERDNSVPQSLATTRDSSFYNLDSSLKHATVTSAVPCVRSVRSLSQYT